MFRHFLILIASALFRGGDDRNRNRGRGGPDTDIETLGDLVLLLDWFHGKLEERWSAWIEAIFALPMDKMAYKYLVPADHEPDEVVDTHAGVETQVITTQCVDPGGNNITIGPNDTNAFYCEGDTGPGLDGTTITGVVYIPLEPLRRVLAGDIWSTRYPLRDQEADVQEQLVLFALTLIGHECGHGVAHAFNTRTFKQPNEPELFSDCIAGNIVAHIEGDIQTGIPDAKLVDAVRTLGFAAIGDVIPPDARNALPQARNRLFFGVHGFAEERRFAFQRGYKAGKDAPADPPSVCFENYFSDVNLSA
jgi:hypothetical protein